MWKDTVYQKSLCKRWICNNQEFVNVIIADLIILPSIWPDFFVVLATRAGDDGGNGSSDAVLPGPFCAQTS